MARGNRREAIARTEEDYESFVRVLSEVCERTGWRVHAWVLMGNHYHLFLETPEANLVNGMSWLQNTYTRRFNVRNRQWGRLFGDRYKAVLVEGGKRRYYETLMDYIHLNPVRAGLVDVSSGASVRNYSWSSVARGYALGPLQRPTWMACEKGLASFGYEDSVDGRRGMVERLDARARAEDRRRCGEVELPGDERRRGGNLGEGWYWGTEAFAEKVLSLGSGAINRERGAGYRSSQEARSHSEVTAEKIVRGGLEAAGLFEADLRKLAGSDPRKVELAREVRERTTVTLKWIADRLQMKSAGNVGQVLYLQRRDRGAQ